jgi:hypothetical protein
MNLSQYIPGNQTNTAPTAPTDNPYTAYNPDNTNNTDNIDPPDPVIPEYDGPPLATSNYPYYKFVKSPEQLGMKDRGNNIATNFTGLLSYVNLLAAGDSKASTTGHPLGNIFFAPTMSKCNDIATNTAVPMHLYFNYIPTGRISLQMDLTDPANEVSVNTGSRGLIPGIIEDLVSLQPAKLLSVLGEPLDVDCQEVTLDTINANNQLGAETRYLSLNDIKGVDPCSFNTNVNPVTNVKCRKPHTHVAPYVPPEIALQNAKQAESAIIPTSESFNMFSNQSNYSIKYYVGIVSITIGFVIILIIFICNIKHFGKCR